MVSDKSRIYCSLTCTYFMETLFRQRKEPNSAQTLHLLFWTRIGFLIKYIDFSFGQMCKQKNWLSNIFMFDA